MPLLLSALDLKMETANCIDKEDLRRKFQIFFLTLTLEEGVYWWKLERRLP